MLWCETSTPDLAEAKKFADAFTRIPGHARVTVRHRSLEKKLDDVTIANFQQELGRWLQFQLSPWLASTLNMSMFHLARGYSQAGMTLTRTPAEDCLAGTGLRAVTHQRFVGMATSTSRTSRFERQFFHDRLAGSTEADSSTAPCRSRRRMSTHRKRTPEIRQTARVKVLPGQGASVLRPTSTRISPTVGWRLEKLRPVRRG